MADHRAAGTHDDSRLIRDLPDLRERTHVFRDRTHAGALLADMLAGSAELDAALITAIPAGGVPVAAEIARRLALPLEVIPVSKILYPWTTESGFGAVAFDGSEWINRMALRGFGLDEAAVRRAAAEARAKVARRTERFRSGHPLPDFGGRKLILVDDGIAAGSTMQAAIQALRNANPAGIVVAVPTAHGAALRVIAHKVDAIYCANIRGGSPFAVADAYEHWTDVNDDDLAAILLGVIPDTIS